MIRKLKQRLEAEHHADMLYDGVNIRVTDADVTLNKLDSSGNILQPYKAQHKGNCPPRCFHGSQNEETGLVSGEMETKIDNEVYLLCKRRQVPGAVRNAFLNARENAASDS